jgi:hypothetical protein
VQKRCKTECSAYLDHTCILDQDSPLGRDRALAFLWGEDSGLLALRRPKLRLDRSLSHGSLKRMDSSSTDREVVPSQTALL